MGIFNLNVGSIFNKKNNTVVKKNDELDPESIKLIKSTPVEGMNLDPIPEKKSSENTEKIQTENRPTEKSPFMIADNQISKLKKVAQIVKQEQIKKVPEPTPEEKHAEKNPFIIKDTFQRSALIKKKQLKEKPPVKKIQKPTPIKRLESKEKLALKGPAKKFNTMQTIAFIIALLIILGLAGIIYYFFIFKTNPTTPVKTPSEIIQPIVKPIVKAGPKYLNLNFQAIATSEDALKKIQKHISEFRIEKESGVTEYIVTDLKNNPVLFKEFSLRLGLNFPDTFLSLIENKMRFFLHNNNGNIGVGIFLKFKEDAILKDEFSKLEADSLEYLSLILPTLKIESSSKPIIFKETTYRGVKNRYYNVTSPDELSIDFIELKDQLFIGTTRETVRSIYDLIKEEEEKGEEKLGDPIESQPKEKLDPKYQQISYCESDEDCTVVYSQSGMLGNTNKYNLEKFKIKFPEMTLDKNPLNKTYIPFCYKNTCGALLEGATRPVE